MKPSNKEIFEQKMKEIAAKKTAWTKDFVEVYQIQRKQKELEKEKRSNRQTFQLSDFLAGKIDSNDENTQIP